MGVSIEKKVSVITNGFYNLDKLCYGNGLIVELRKQWDRGSYIKEKGYINPDAVTIVNVQVYPRLQSDLTSKELTELFFDCRAVLDDITYKNGIILSNCNVDYTGIGDEKIFYIDIYLCLDYDLDSKYEKEASW